MKSSDLTIGKGYAWNSARLRPEQRPYYQFHCVVPLDNKVYHTYVKETAVIDGQRNVISRTKELVMEPGRKALGYGKDAWNTTGKPYIEGCGVPCMVATSTGNVTPNTRWAFKLIDPRCIWDEDWNHWNTVAKAKADAEEAQRQAREQARLLRESIVLRLSTVLTDERILSTMPMDDNGKRKLMYEKINYGVNSGGLIIGSAESMTWLATLLEDYIEVQEQIKDLQYELED